MISLSLTTIVIYALLIAGGGIMGYVKSNSKVSLGSGLGSAAMLLVARGMAQYSLGGG